MDINVLVGMTIRKVDKTDAEIVFSCHGRRRFKMYHSQDCCESVWIEDICGDLNDLCHSPVITATEQSNRDNPREEYEESCTWTFYKIDTVKGGVTIRWYGTSNGYYSEGVDFEEIDPAPEADCVDGFVNMYS